jgi:DNA-binding CsgD family transcriptional regulator
MTAKTCFGRPCFRSIAARSRDGRPFCEQRCPVFRAIESRDVVEPVTLQVGGNKSAGRWVQLVVIPLWRPDHSGPFVVHCAWSADPAHRAEQYLARVASRSAVLRDPGKTIGDLTRREEEILHHLAMDEDLPSVAASLCVSYVTVRNHVQHILSKLQVHSIQEAVAVHLLRGQE